MLNGTDRDFQATAAAESGAAPVTEYQYRVPSPPHIIVPSYNDDKEQVLPQFTGIYHGRRDEILKHVTKGNYKVKTKDWQYTWRREGQAILAFLYLGPASVARDVEFLRREGITMLLVVRDNVAAEKGLYDGRVAAKELGIPSTFINIANNQSLIREFPAATQIINNHLEEQFLLQGGLEKHPDQDPDIPCTWGKILVFCDSGNERSPAVVAAYLMEMYQLDIVSAIQYIQQRRFCVAFDDGLKTMLQTYHDILVAQRTIASSTSSVVLEMLKNDAQSVTIQQNGRKRRAEDMTIDEEMNDEMHGEMGGYERQNFTPFS